jgi:hypothetical protein
MHNLNPIEVADHPMLVLLRLQQAGELTQEDIDAEFRETITDPELLGIILGEIDDGLGDNSGEIIEMEAPTAELKPLLPLPPKPAAMPVEDANTLAETMRLKQEQTHNPIRTPIIPPNWSVAKPTPVQDLGEQQPLNW